MRLCSIVGCLRRHYARDLCRSHYMADRAGRLDRTPVASVRGLSQMRSAG